MAQTTIDTRFDDRAIDRGIRTARAVAFLGAGAVGLLALYWTESRSILYVLVVLLPLAGLAFRGARRRLRPRSGPRENAVSIALAVLAGWSSGSSARRST